MLAELGLKGLPHDKRSIHRIAEREGWHKSKELTRIDRAKGGTVYYYHLDLLPLEAQIDYASRFIRIESKSAKAPTSEADLNAAAHYTRDARLALVEAADQFQRNTDLKVSQADLLFVQSYKAGLIDIKPWIKRHVSSLSARSLSRWRKRIRHGRYDDLAVDKSQSRAKTGVLESAEQGAVKKVILGLIAKNPHLTAKHIRSFVSDQFGRELKIISEVTGEIKIAKLPPIRTFQYTLKQWKQENAIALQALCDPDGFKNRSRFVATGTTKASYINEIWEVDASPADMLTTDGRVNIYAAVDVFTRRMIVLVTKTPKSEGVAMLIRKAIKAWGVPSIIKTDNGTDFVSHAIQRLFYSLGIEQEKCAPYTPEGKGIVERHIRTFQHDLIPTLEGFVGHNVSERKVIEGRKAFSKRLGQDDAHLFDVAYSMQDLQKLADEWCENTHAHNEHSGLRGQTPYHMALKHQKDVRVIDNEAALDILLAPIAGKDGYRTVTKLGIRVDGYAYMIGSVMPGTRVFCRMSPEDMGRLYVFEEDGETFIGKALCPELVGLDPAEVIQRVRAEQKAHIEGRLKDIRKEARRIGKGDIAAAIRRENSHKQGAVLSFPATKEKHETNSLKAAAQVLIPEEKRFESPVDARVSAMQAKIDADMAGNESAHKEKNVRPLREYETPHQRFRRAQKMLKRIHEGKELEQTEALWLGGYVKGPEYRAMAAMEKDFSDGVQETREH